MSMLSCSPNEYGIGTTPSGIVSLRWLGVPMPDQALYSAASVHYVRSDFHRVSDGFASIQWIYDIASLPVLYRLNAFLEGETSKVVYIQSDVRDGTFPNPSTSFKVFEVHMWKPILTGEEGVSVARSSLAYQTVKYTFMKAVEQAGYL